MLRSRSFVATVLAAALVPVPGLAAAPAAPVALMAQPASPAEPAPGEAVPTDAAGGEEVPTEVPVEEPKAEEPEPPAEEAATPVPEGPERPPEPTLGNGKFKAKGTGLMISGGVLLGLGVVGVLTSYFLTHCPDGQVDDSFACKNRQHSTFAVPATGAAALLGAVLLAVGLGYRARYKRWENWDPNRAKTALRPTFSAGGVGFRF